MARQDPRYAKPEEGKDAKRTYTLKLAQLRWTGLVTRMLDERLPKKVFYGKLQKGKRYKDTLKDSLTDFNIPTESGEQAAQDRTKWRCLINKGAGQYEAKKSVKLTESTKSTKQEPTDIIRVSTVRVHWLYLQPTV